MSKDTIAQVGATMAQIIEQVLKLIGGLLITLVFYKITKIGNRNNLAAKCSRMLEKK